MSKHVVPVNEFSEHQYEQLHRFFDRVYDPAKAHYLTQHGNWLHRGDEHRLGVLVDDTIAGYCALIPTTTMIDGHEVDSMWWVDLIVTPEYRGQGLQRLMDEAVRELGQVKLGFPNELAAKIHRKHGWGVIETIETLLLPLRPRKVRSVRRASGRRGVVLKGGAMALELPAAFWRWRMHRRQPHSTHLVPAPDAEMLAGIFYRTCPHDLATTCRDEEYLRWRYFEAPYRAELAFYTAGPVGAPTHYLVARHKPEGDHVVTRVLDLFGDFRDEQAMRDLIQCMVRDAVRRNSVQVTALVTLPEVRAALRGSGFLLGDIARFCWLSESNHFMQQLGERTYWTIGDSDADTPD